VAVKVSVSPPARDRDCASGTTTAAVGTARSKTASRPSVGSGPDTIVRVMLRLPPLACTEAHAHRASPREGTWSSAVWSFPALSVARQDTSSVPPPRTLGDGKVRTGPATRRRAMGVMLQRAAWREARMVAGEDDGVRDGVGVPVGVGEVVDDGVGVDDGVWVEDGVGEGGRGSGQVAFGSVASHGGAMSRGVSSGSGEGSTTTTGSAEDDGDGETAVTPSSTAASSSSGSGVVVASPPSVSHEVRTAMVHACWRPGDPEREV
jgi:hypothetical protein